MVTQRKRRASELALVAERAAECTQCDLYLRATQTVFGEGPVPSSLMLVGEQPGDKEDTAGRPFVGPAGRILDEALAGAGLERSDLYLTNAVKHFKWKQRGKRRIHQRPNGEEISACSSWLKHELDHVEPKVVVALGATAVTALIGGRPTITSLRGTPQQSQFGVPTVVTVHPASIVRLREREERDAELNALVADLLMAVDLASKARKLRSVG